jgi:hypothetical protein
MGAGLLPLVRSYGGESASGSVSVNRSRRLARGRLVQWLVFIIERCLHPMDLSGAVRASAAGLGPREPRSEPHEQDRQLLGAYTRLHESERHPAERRLRLDPALPATSNVSCSVAASAASPSAELPAPRPDRVAGGFVAPRISFRRALSRHLLRGCPDRFRPSKPDVVDAPARADPSPALATAA